MKQGYRSWAIFFAREILGFIFFMAGVYKVFQLGLANIFFRTLIHFSLPGHFGEQGY
jgi:uncharacterized membrane protein YphA (DoxX/SURF4 family)